MQKWEKIFESRGMPSGCIQKILNRSVNKTGLIEIGDQWLSFPKCRSERSSLLLHGPTGRGKTMTASYIVSHQIVNRELKRPPWARGGFSEHEDVPGAMFTTASKLQRLLMADAFNKPSAGLLRWMRITPLLAIDELGREVHDQHGYVKAGLYDLLVERLDSADLRTVFTSNYKDGWLETRYGEAMMDRWNRKGIVIPVDSCEYRRGI